MFSPTGGTRRREGCAGLAVVANRTLRVSAGKGAVTVVPLGAIKAFRGPGTVHVRSWSMQR